MTPTVPSWSPEALTEDDIYCRCLSRTLCHTATPVTVGFYAPCGHRLYSLLDKVTGGCHGATTCHPR